jgi:hypothetical protein
VITRRRLLTGGIAAVGALAVAGLIYESSPDHAQADPRFRYTILDDEDRAIVAVIAPVLLEGALPGGDAVLQVVRGTDVAIAGLPLAVRAEVRQLLGILRFAPTRMLVAGIWHPWHQASAPEIARFLQSWRRSPIAQLRSAYDALHQLVLASWYGNDASWPAIGYPGPPKVRA